MSDCFRSSCISFVLGMFFFAVADVCFLGLPRRWNLPGHLPGFHPDGLERSGQTEPLPAVRHAETLTPRGRRGQADSVVIRVKINKKSWSVVQLFFALKHQTWLKLVVVFRFCWKIKSTWIYFFISAGPLSVSEWYTVKASKKKKIFFVTFKTNQILNVKEKVNQKLLRQSHFNIPSFKHESMKCVT